MRKCILQPDLFAGITKAVSGPHLPEHNLTSERALNQDIRECSNEEVRCEPMNNKHILRSYRLNLHAEVHTEQNKDKTTGGLQLMSVHFLFIVCFSG